jgi:hypothetical protein
VQGSLLQKLNFFHSYFSNKNNCIGPFDTSHVFLDLGVIPSQA